MAKELDMQKLFSMIEGILTGIGVFEMKGDELKLLYMNEGGYRMLGYTQEEGVRYVNSLYAMILEEDRSVFRQMIVDVLKDDGAVEAEFRTVTANGGLRWHQVRANLYSRKEDSAVAVCVFSDATDRKNVEEELHMQIERYEMLSDTDREIIMDYNVMTDVITFKTAKRKDFEGDVIIDRFLKKANGSGGELQDFEKFCGVLNDAVKSPRRDMVEFKISLKKGLQARWQRANIASIAGVDGYVTRVVGRITDIHEDKLKEQELREKAQTDDLTGWYNKASSRQRIVDALLKSQPDSLHAFMVLDLDNFKLVNDFLGHAQGDAVLAGVSERMKAIFKGADVLGRIGGDEFVIFVRDVGTIADVDIVAAGLLAATDVKKISPVGKEIRVTGSIGISLYPYHGTSYEDLFQKADKALYSVKESGKAGYRIYEAATTLSRHVSPDLGRNVENYRQLKDLILQILYEDKCNETAIRSILELIAGYYHFQKAYLYIKKEDGTLHKAVWHYEKGYESQKDNMRRTELKFRALEEFLRGQKGFNLIHSYDNIPESVSTYMIENGIKAIVAYPMVKGGRIQGLFILEEYTDGTFEIAKEQEEELCGLIRTVQTYAVQIGYRDSLKGNMTQLEMLDDFDSFVYVVDVDNYEICFMNKKVKELTPEIQIGDLCYQTIRNEKSPCEDCVLRRLDMENAHSRWTEETFNYSLRTWTKCHASWFCLSEEKKLGLMNCMDISDYFNA